jgi:hypothetical protein
LHRRIIQIAIALPSTQPRASALATAC